MTPQLFEVILHKMLPPVGLKKYKRFVNITNNVMKYFYNKNIVDSPIRNCQNILITLWKYSLNAFYKFSKVICNIV